MTNSVIRYSDAELAEFKALIEKKRENFQEQLDNIQEQILEITENSSDEHGGDWVDDSSINNDMEMLNNMAIRQRMYLQELENALVRIRNKSYGICTITGELIDKRRLLAVPTTTKSLQAKTTISQGNNRNQKTRTETSPPRKTGNQPKVITKIIRKSSPATSGQKDKSAFFDEDEDDDLFFDNENSPIEKDVDGLDGIDLEDEDMDDIVVEEMDDEDEDNEKLDS